MQEMQVQSLGREDTLEKTLVVVLRLPIVVAPFVLERGFRSCSSQALEHTLNSCGAQA